MDDNEIDKIAKFYSIMDIGAKMGGTKPFDRFAPYIVKAMNEFADELDKKYGEEVKGTLPGPPPDTEPMYQQESQDLPDVPTGAVEEPSRTKREEQEKAEREQRARDRDETPDQRREREIREGEVENRRRAAAAQSHARVGETEQQRMERETQEGEAEQRRKNAQQSLNTTAGIDRR